MSARPAAGTAEPFLRPWRGLRGRRARDQPVSSCGRVHSHIGGVLQAGAGVRGGSPPVQPHRQSHPVHHAQQPESHHPPGPEGRAGSEGGGWEEGGRGGRTNGKGWAGGVSAAHLFPLNSTVPRPTNVLPSWGALLPSHQPWSWTVPSPESQTLVPAAAKTSWRIRFPPFHGPDVSGAFTRLLPLNASFCLVMSRILS